jgi:ribose transport system substrate-binding protein
MLSIGAAGAFAKTITIGHISGSLAAFSQVRVKEAMEYLCKNKYNWKITSVECKADWNLANSQIENFVARKVDAITLAMMDLRSLKSGIDAANRAGIPIYSIDSGYVPGIVVDVASNNFVIGSIMGSYMVDRLDHKGKIVSIGMNQHHGVRNRRQALDPILVENPDVKLLSHFDCTYANFYNDARKAMEDYLSRYGKDIDAVWCGWDDLADAASKAIMERGFTREDLIVVAADGHPSAYAHIRNPKDPFEATVAQKFDYFAAITCDLIDKIVVKGVKPEAVVPKGMRIYVDSPIVDPTNVPEEGKLPWKLAWE